MLFLCWLASSFAMDPAPVLAKLDETAQYRALRLDRTAPAIPRDAWIRAAEKERTQSGLIQLDGETAKQIWAVAVLDVPIERIWAAVNDDKNKPDYSSVDYAEVLSGGLCGSPRKVFQYLPIGWGVTPRWWVIDVRSGKKLYDATHGHMREQYWTSGNDWTVPTETAQTWADKGMHINKTYGSWLLIDLDGKRTLVEYTTFADPGGSLPAGFASKIAASNIDETFTAMTTLARKGPACKIKPPTEPEPSDPAAEPEAQSG